MKTKSKLSKAIFIILSVLLSQIPALAQSGKLIGVVDNNLVKINPQTGDLTQLVAVNVPNNEVVANLVYLEEDCLFYSIIDAAGTPSLVSIDWAGNYNFIGSLSLPGETIYLCESLSYNPFEDKMYASVSLNGGISNNDYASEALVEVNPLNASAVFKTSMAPNATQENDFDDMTFIGNILYIHDGNPGGNITRFYELDFQGLGATANPTEIFSGSYESTRDLAPIGDLLYFTTNDLKFFVLNTLNNNLNYIGQTHSPAEYNGSAIWGLDYVELEVLELLNIDTVLCTGESLTLSTGLNDAIVTWNTGAVQNEIEVNTAGTYWAEVFVDDCYYSTDTAIIEYQFCDTCSIIFDQISDNLFLGNDTILCDFQALDLSVEPGIPSVIEWSTSETGNSISVNQTGDYWANVTYGDCEWSTDTISLLMEPCDTCEFVRSQVEDLLFLGNDSTFCEDGEFQIEINLDDTYDIFWNTGDVGSTTFANNSGVYWANIIAGDCSFISDSIYLETVNCSPCQYYIPNVFSPQGDGINDIFKVNFDNETCDIVSFNMSVFDRWGGLIIETEVNAWYGDFNGKPMGTGVYVYIIRMITNVNGELIEVLESGSVTLLR